MQPGVSRDDVRVTTVKPYVVTGEVLDIKRQESVFVLLNGCEFTQASDILLLQNQSWHPLFP